LKVDGRFNIPQTYAILRFLGNKFHLYGNNEFDRAIIDSVLESSRSIKEKVLEITHNQSDEQKEEALKTFLAEDKGQRLKQLEILFDNYGRHGPFFLGSHISLADLAVYDCFYELINHDAKLLDEHPKLKEHRKRVEKHPQMVNYLKPPPIKQQKSSESKGRRTKSPTPVAAAPAATAASSGTTRRGHSHERRQQKNIEQPVPIEEYHHRHHHHYNKHRNEGKDQSQTHRHHRNRQSKSPSANVNASSKEKNENTGATEQQSPRHSPVNVQNESSIQRD